LDFLVTLGHRSVTFDLFNRNLQMSGPVSKRKDNFPMILQHDLPLEREAMGAPLFDIEGKCIGFNIARVDRVTVYALPSSDIKQKVDSFLDNLSY
jgi:S1-C subfamily serine protease